MIADFYLTAHPWAKQMAGIHGGRNESVHLNFYWKAINPPPPDSPLPAACQYCPLLFHQQKIYTATRNGHRGSLEMCIWKRRDIFELSVVQYREPSNHKANSQLLGYFNSKKVCIKEIQFLAANNKGGFLLIIVHLFNQTNQVTFLAK